MKKEPIKQKDRTSGPLEINCPQPLTAPRPWEKTGRCGVADLLVWVYRDQQAHKRGAGGHLFPAEAAAGGLMAGDALRAVNSAQILEHERIGCKIDSSRSMGYDLHIVAETVDSWVDGGPMASEIVDYAKAGRQPTAPSSLRPVFRPALYDRRGRPVSEKVTAYTGNRVGYPLEFTRVRCSNTAEDIRYHGDAFYKWMIAVNSLALVLDEHGGLDFEVTQVTQPEGLLDDKRGISFGGSLPAHLKEGTLPPF